jgi:F-type H+-transporting ATPase subunit gamma
MAKARALDKRRKAIRNIRKITRTMELVARASFSRAMARAVAASAYTRRITALVGHLMRSGLEAFHPLLEPHEPVRFATLLVLTANRGLCGGYNASVFRLAAARWQTLVNEVPEPRVEVSGKRGIVALRFRGVHPHETFTHFKDKPSFEEVEVLADRYLDWYLSGRLDRLEVAYTKFESLSRQHAVIETLLPFAEPEGKRGQVQFAGNGQTNLRSVPGASHKLDLSPFSVSEREEENEAETRYEFLPSAETILDEVVPASFKVRLFKCFLDAAVSEQLARMTAMKAATENADAMINMLTMTYNRARQGQITSELLEVISGADALNE